MSTVPVEPQHTAPTLTAYQRVQRSRDRKKNGLRCITLEIWNAEISKLVKLGFLAPDRAKDNAAVRDALYDFLDQHLGKDG